MSIIDKVKGLFKQADAKNETGSTEPKMVGIDIPETAIVVIDGKHYALKDGKLVETPYEEAEKLEGETNETETQMADEAYAKIEDLENALMAIGQTVAELQKRVEELEGGTMEVAQRVSDWFTIENKQSVSDKTTPTTNKTDNRSIADKLNNNSFYGK